MPRHLPVRAREAPADSDPGLSAPGRGPVVVRLRRLGVRPSDVTSESTVTSSADPVHPDRQVSVSDGGLTVTGAPGSLPERPWADSDPAHSHGSRSSGDTGRGCAAREKHGAQRAGCADAAHHGLYMIFVLSLQFGIGPSEWSEAMAGLLSRVRGLAQEWSHAAPQQGTTAAHADERARTAAGLL